MTDNINRKSETKTVAATWAAFLASGAALALLESLDLSGLPAWLVVPAGMVVTSAVTWLAAYRTSHAPGRLSLSAIKALNKRPVS